jgi:hypothetical protein
MHRNTAHDRFQAGSRRFSMRFFASPVSAIGCDFNRSTQHFVRKPLPRKNVFESTEWLKIQRNAQRLSMEILATLPN